ncbi:MAG: radical SAM protein [Candidatus Altiarchaeota archaeon]
MSGSAREDLPDYFRILDGGGRAKYLGCEDVSWKAAEAESILSSCRLCERRCGVDRIRGVRGFCGVLEHRVSSEFLHFGEEPELVPSYTVFFAGCTFSCVFCQNWNISQNPGRGVKVSSEEMAGMIEGVSARNVNWVGGDPTPNLPFIIDVLAHLKKNIPQVWNSNMYVTEESMALLDGLMDVYLTDFKYGCDECALRYSLAPDYWRIVTRNHLEARRQAEVIIRHLVMPGHVECCTKPILTWIADNLENVRVNIMDQYRPEYQALDFPEINRRIDTNEYREAREFAEKLGLNLV